MNSCDGWQLHPKDPMYDTQKYLKEKDVLRLFEAMSAAVMFHKPDDPVGYLAQRMVRDQPQ